MPPRYFWRRLCALFIDASLVGMLSAVLVLPLHLAFPDKVRLADGLFKSRTCFQSKQIHAEAANIIAPERIHTITYCHTRPYFAFPPQFSANIIYDFNETKSGALTRRSQKILTFSAAPDGRPLHPITPQRVLAPLLFILLGAAFLRRKSGRTPGKALLKLRVEGVGCHVCREFRKTAPVLFVQSMALISALVPTGTIGTVPVVASVIFGLVLALFFLVYYGLPILRWRGAMPWDRTTGFYVSRTSIKAEP